MNILILGGGGREHALAWAVLQNPKCDRLIVAPGNAGIADIAECAAIDICDGDVVAGFCDAESVDFVVIGPEAPLAAGVADRLRAAGILTFGPSAAAARLETSKGFTKDVCDAAAIPTAAWARFDDRAAAMDHIRAAGAPIVVKADGLAAGKGVTVAETVAEALAAVDAVFTGPGASVVIEAVLRGEEASFFVLCHGTDALPIGSAQDHKRIGEGDTGPNTGGMGAFSPARIVTRAVAERVMETIIRPALAEMARRDMPYQGVLYAGLMIDAGVPSLIEFNARFGDPEAQVLAIRLGAQLLDLMLACARGDLSAARPAWADDHAMTVVMAAPGYPGPPETGQPIGGLAALPETSEAIVFHAGTARDGGGRVVSAGGRVLGVTARGATLADARDRAYRLVDRIDWPNAQYRRDIGWRALDLPRRNA
jgi:phosphoribosylamine--glycine ligase